VQDVRPARRRAAERMPCVGSSPASGAPPSGVALTTA